MERFGRIMKNKRTQISKIDSQSLEKEVKRSRKTIANSFDTVRASVVIANAIIQDSPVLRRKLSKDKRKQIDDFVDLASGILDIVNLIHDSSGFTMPVSFKDRRDIISQNHLPL